MRKLKLLYRYIEGNLLQIVSSFCTSSLLGFVTFSVPDKILNWIVLNVDYILIALFLVAIDHLSGSIVHFFYKKDFQLLLNIVGLLIRVGVVVGVGSAFEALTHLVKEDHFIFTYLQMVSRLLVCLYPFRSMLINVKIITKGRFPPDTLIGKIDDFNKDLDLKHFKNKE